VFPRERIAIFLDGCFWHGHDCRNTKPSDNKDYWTNKIGRNIQRDKEVTEILTEKNWKVIRIWECKLKNQDYIIDLIKGST
jgi:DNA mismatch endonuclease (patch repair protein)